MGPAGYPSTTVSPSPDVRLHHELPYLQVPDFLVRCWQFFGLHLAGPCLLVYCFSLYYLFHMWHVSMPRLLCGPWETAHFKLHMLRAILSSVLFSDVLALTGMLSWWVQVFVL